MKVALIIVIFISLIGAIGEKGNNKEVVLGMSSICVAAIFALAAIVIWS